uniref:Uncharacterized protein n=1 Tax=Ascaris lumbricoides TaxID=6252 RepID=A0A9J2PH19_ASCLU
MIRRRSRSQRRGHGARRCHNGNLYTWAVSDAIDTPPVTAQEIADTTRPHDMLQKAICYRVIILEALKSEVLRQVHKGNPGVGTRKSHHSASLESLHGKKRLVSAAPARSGNRGASSGNGNEKTRCQNGSKTASDAIDEMEDGAGPGNESCPYPTPPFLC